MSVCSRNAHGHVTRAILCGIDRKNAGPVFRGQRFVRACAVETHMDISEERLFVVIYRQKCPHTTPPTSIEHRAFYPYGTNPLSVATLFGEKT